MSPSLLGGLGASQQEPSHTSPPSISTSSRPASAGAASARAPPIPTGIQGFIYDIRTAILPFMFIFNADLILHNVNNWPQGLLIFAMACFGNFAFVAATQGW